MNLRIREFEKVTSQISVFNLALCGSFMFLNGIWVLVILNIWVLGDFVNG